MLAFFLKLIFVAIYREIMLLKCIIYIITAYVSMHVYFMYLCMYTHICAYILCICIYYICMDVCVYIHMYVCMMHVYMPICMYACMYVCIHVCMVEVKKGTFCNYATKVLQYFVLKTTVHTM